MTDESTATNVSGMQTMPTHDHPTTPVGFVRRAVSTIAGHPSTPTTDRPAQATTRPTTTDRLRYVPPVAALGTAFVMQVIAVTDTVGEKFAATLAGSPAPWLATHNWVGYLTALLLGVAVASCAEGGAAYLMDLYDKHLIARDTTWMLRLAMLVYVAASAAAIHWWTAHRHLPEVTSWLLAGMSASALFLWSRGSRWRNRKAMRDAGQLDPALPKLPMAAKFWHPIRSLNTMRLVSWEPVATTDEARSRYDEWRHARRAAKPTGPVDTPVAPVGTDQDPTNQPTTPTDRPRRPRPTTPRATEPKRTSRPGLSVVGEPAAVANARLLRERYGDDLPTSIRKVRTDTGWSKDRADRAVEAYQAGADQTGKEEAS